MFLINIKEEIITTCYRNRTSQYLGSEYYIYQYTTGVYLYQYLKYYLIKIINIKYTCI